MRDAPSQPSGTSRDRGGPYLTVTVNHVEVLRKPLPDQRPTTIGRALDCELWLEDPVLSRKHCMIEPALEGDGFVVVDLQSRNGTYLNAKKVHDRAPLNDGDVITVGHAHLKFHAKGYVPPRPKDVEEALKMPANRNAMRVVSGSTSQRPLPRPSPRSTSAANADTITPGDSRTGDKSLPFTRPPAKPMVKPEEET